MTPIHLASEPGTSVSALLAGYGASVARDHFLQLKVPHLHLVITAFRATTALQLTVDGSPLARQNKRRPSGPTTYQLQPLKLVAEPDLAGEGAPLRVWHS